VCVHEPEPTGARVAVPVAYGGEGGMGRDGERGGGVDVVSGSSLFPLIFLSNQLLTTGSIDGGIHVWVRAPSSPIVTI
jgi:hypothetical protein